MEVRSLNKEINQVFQGRDVVTKKHSQLSSLRKSSEELITRIPVPTQKSEAFRYTSLKDVAFNRHPEVLGASVDIPKGIWGLDEEEAGYIHLNSGSEAPVERATLKSQVEEQGVYFQDLKTALKEKPELLESLKCPESMKTDLFAQLVTARWQNGVVLVVPANVKVELPFRAVFSFDERTGVFFYRTLIIAEPNSEVTYIDYQIGNEAHQIDGTHPLASGLVEVIAGEGARVNYIQVQSWSSLTHHFARQRFELNENASLKNVSVSVGGLKGQIRSESLCQGRGAKLSMIGATRGSDKQHFDSWVQTRHVVPDTTSELEYWTVMADQARSVFNGTIDITQEAVRTDAVQRNKNLLLSEKAVVETLPKLEIATDDVKCAHGASVSSINSDQLYYLQTRGLSKKEAESMVVEGFTKPAVLELPTKKLQAKVGAYFRHKNMEMAHHLGKEAVNLSPRR